VGLVSRTLDQKCLILEKERGGTRMGEIKDFIWDQQWRGSVVLLREGGGGGV